MTSTQDRAFLMWARLRAVYLWISQRRNGRQSEPYIEAPKAEPKAEEKE